MSYTISLDKLADPRPICRSCVSSSDPIFITEDGEERMVLLNFSSYRKLLGKVQVYQALEEGEVAIENGDEMDAFEHLESLRRRCRA